LKTGGGGPFWQGIGKGSLLFAKQQRDHSEHERAPRVRAAGEPAPSRVTKRDTEALANSGLGLALVSVGLARMACSQGSHRTTRVAGGADRTPIIARVQQVFHRCGVATPSAAAPSLPPLDDRFRETDHIGCRRRFLVNCCVAAHFGDPILVGIRFEPWKRPTSPPATSNASSIVQTTAAPIRTKPTVTIFPSTSLTSNGPACSSLTLRATGHHGP